MQQQPRKPNTTIWGLIVLAIFIAIAATHHDGPARVNAATQATDAPATSAPLSIDYCESAVKYASQASSDIGAHDYRGAYTNANSGLAKSESCTDDTRKLVSKAFLLSMKGMAEQHLSEGDSRTDLNQANMLLEQCQTQPGLYGTSEGASCETQQQYNIRAQTNADLNQ